MSTSRLRVLLVAGARPNFMKVAPIARVLAQSPDQFSSTIVHTGQHYDATMSQVFFDQLGIPRPDVNLNVGSGSHAQQTAAVMSSFEPVLLEKQPDVLIVVGDVNSTLACALVAAKLRLTIAHVEAGLRSWDRSMPEEINRVLTDQISDLLFTTEPSAATNLEREGISPAKIHPVGNVMIDTLLAHRARARELDVPTQLGFRARQYALLTLHRPGNVDDRNAFERIMTGIGGIAHDVPVIFPVHPRTRPAVIASPVAAALIRQDRLRLLEPLAYLEFLGLMEASAAVLTDSGGIQEETTILQVPCLTLRDNTERPATVTEGTNTIVGTDPARMLEAWRKAQSYQPSGRVPALWDGRAANRIAAVLRQMTVASS